MCGEVDKDVTTCELLVTLLSSNAQEMNRFMNRVSPYPTCADVEMNQKLAQTRESILYFHPRKSKYKILYYTQDAVNDNTGNVSMP